MVTFFQKPTCMESDACYRAPKQTFFGQPKFPFGKKSGRNFLCRYLQRELF